MDTETIVVVVVLVVSILLLVVIIIITIQTNKEMKINKPDFLVKDKQERTSLLITMPIPTERNASPKNIEKKPP